MFALLPPATKLGQGNIFRSVCQEFCPRGGMHSGGCMVGGVCGKGMHGGWCAWQGGMHGRGMGHRGACMAGEECMAGEACMVGVYMVGGHAW